MLKLSEEENKPQNILWLGLNHLLVLLSCRIHILIGLVTLTLFRSSHQRFFIPKRVLRNFIKFTGKHLCQSLFFNKVLGLRPATLSKKRLWRRCFPVNFVKFLRTPFFIEHLWWLLLPIQDGVEQNGTPYQFFPCNFYKRRN